MHFATEIVAQSKSATEPKQDNIEMTLLLLLFLLSTIGFVYASASTSQEEAIVDCDDVAVGERDEQEPTPPRQSARRVAIIGAGIGGAAVAYYVNQALPNADIHVFEASSRVAGRIANVELEDGARVEVGASLWVEQNRLMNELVDQLGLTREPKDARSVDPHWSGKHVAGSFGVFDGETMVFQKQPGFYGTIASLWRYGWSPIETVKVSQRGNYNLFSQK